MNATVKMVAAVFAWTLMLAAATVCLMSFCNEYLNTGWDLITSFVVVLLLCMVFGWGKADPRKGPYGH